MKGRALLVAAGTALMAYGGWLVLRQVEPTAGYLLSLGAWLGIGPPTHDLLLAPAVALGGLLLARLLPAPWRTSVTAGLVTTGILVLVGLPVMTRPGPGPTNPGLHDRDYPGGLLLFIAIMWALLLVGTAVRSRRRPRPRSGHAPPPRPN